MVKIKDPDSVKQLCAAIISQAYKDLVHSLDYRKEHEVDSVKIFMRSDWFKSLSDGIDGEKIIKAAYKRHEYNCWRAARNCSKCKCENCPHRGTNGKDGIPENYKCLLEELEGESQWIRLKAKGRGIKRDITSAKQKDYVLDAASRLSTNRHYVRRAGRGRTQHKRNIGVMDGGGLNES